VSLLLIISFSFSFSFCSAKAFKPLDKQHLKKMCLFESFHNIESYVWCDKRTISDSHCCNWVGFVFPTNPRRCRWSLNGNSQDACVIQCLSRAAGPCEMIPSFPAARETQAGEAETSAFQSINAHCLHRHEAAFFFNGQRQSRYSISASLPFSRALLRCTFRSWTVGFINRWPVGRVLPLWPGRLVSRSVAVSTRFWHWLRGLPKSDSGWKDRASRSAASNAKLAMQSFPKHSLGYSWRDKAIQWKPVFVFVFTQCAAFSIDWTNAGRFELAKRHSEAIRSGVRGFPWPNSIRNFNPILNIIFLSDRS
jgi:hypothetical protein